MYKLIIGIRREGQTVGNTQIFIRIPSHIMQSVFNQELTGLHVQRREALTPGLKI
jgi:hypothetical protein